MSTHAFVRARILLLLVACIGATSAPVRAETDASESPSVRADALRRAGDDASAVTVLEGVPADQRTPRIEAELGLALMATDRAREAEAHLRSALSSTSDAWVSMNRRSLETALWCLQRGYGVLRLATDPPDATVTIDGTEIRSRPATESFSLPSGEITVRIDAPGRQSVVRSVVLGSAQSVSLAVSLPILTCPDAAMVVGDSITGTCCWPGQGWTPTGGCAGLASCPAGYDAVEGGCGVHSVVADAPAPAVRRPTGFRLALRTGFSQFLGADTGLFRLDADDSQASITARVPLELRFGWRFVRFLSLDVGGGVARDFVSHWNGGLYGPDIEPDAIDYWAGVYLDFHTSRARKPGAVDFFFGGGFEPYHRMQFKGEDSSGNTITSSLRGWSAPVELGFSFFLTKGMAFDVLGVYRFWLPRQYCGGDVNNPGAPLCLERDALTSLEMSWSVQGGFSWLLGR